MAERVPGASVTLLDVAAFRHICRERGIQEVTAQGSTLRFAPVELRDSQQLRLKRLHPRAVYKPAVQLISVPRPVEGAGRIGAPPLRDRELLDWCTRLVTGVLDEPVAGAAR